MNSLAELIECWLSPLPCSNTCQVAFPFLMLRYPCYSGKRCRSGGTTGAWKVMYPLLHLTALQHSCSPWWEAQCRTHPRTCTSPIDMWHVSNVHQSPLGARIDPTSEAAAPPLLPSMEPFPRCQVTPSRDTATPVMSEQSGSVIVIEG
jgi:hypothetical protein